jgi:uncharacterized membrane protein
MKPLSLLNWIKNLHPNARLAIALGVSGLALLIMPSAMDWEIHVLGSWDAGVLCFLALIGCMLINTSPTQTMAYARLRGFNSASVFSLVVLTAFISIFVIGVMLTDSKDTPPPFRAIQIWLSLIAILSSWLLTHSMFALHYAHIYYKTSDSLNPSHAPGGLQFPNEDHPDYLDFMYFAFTISMASQTSDVVITARPMRRLVLLHSMVSFFFYSVILATAINTIASLV